MVCRKFGLDCSDKWYEHFPRNVEENDEVKLLWDFKIQTGQEIHHWKPDIIVTANNKTREPVIKDTAVPCDNNMVKKCEKKYQDLTREIQRQWKSKAKVVPVVVGVLGSMSQKLKGFLKKLRIQVRKRTMQSLLSLYWHLS